MTSTTRGVIKVIQGHPTSDGAGVKLTRIIGTPDLNFWDPFLLLDEFKNDNPADYIGGFPPHPHRGFETVTYMLAGNFTHEDSKGNRGHLQAGSIQWMTAGKGLIHSEMPAQEDGLVWGFQLWLNLPARLKWIEPKYQDIGPEKIPSVEKDGLRVKVLSGEYGGKKGPGQAYYPLTYLDVEMQPKAPFEFQAPATQNTLIYVISGDVLTGPEGQSKKVTAGQLAILANGDLVRLQSGDTAARLLFLSAEKINEPVARGGPFVMNTREEVMQAFDDYQNGRF